MKELKPNILDNYDLRVKKIIENCKSEFGFPQMDDYHVEKEELEGYLFDYQACIDSEGSDTAQLTLYSIIVLCPVLVLNAFPQDSLPWRSDIMSLAIGLLVGAVIAVAVKGIRVWLRRHRLSQLRAENQKVAAYVDAVLKHESLNRIS